MAERQIIIRRAKLKETRIQNTIIWDENLSIMARFSLIAMLSLPDTWDYSIRGMAAKLGVSKDTMAKYLKELEAAGYLMRQQLRDNGSFAKAAYILTDTPGDFGEELGEEEADSPCPNFSDPKTSNPKNSPQKKRTKQKNDTKQDSPKAPRGASGDRVDLDEDAKILLNAYVGQDRELTDTMRDLMAIRTKKKAVNSGRAIKNLLNELDRLSGGDRATKLAILRQSVINSWKGVFPLKGGSPPPTAAPSRGVIEEEGTYRL